jgi:hypothetical protein
MKRRLATIHPSNGKAPIKGRQFTGTQLSQTQQVRVCDLRSGQNPAHVNGARFDKTEVLGPKAVTGQTARFSDDFGNNGG